MRWKAFLFVFGALAVTLVAQTLTHPIASPATVSFVEYVYNTDGSTRSMSQIRQTVRKDGSSARETVTFAGDSAEPYRVRQIRDVSASRATTAYYALGVKVVEELDPIAKHAYHMRARDCARAVAQIGTPVDGQDLVRSRKEGISETQLTFDAALACDLTEYRHTQAGRIVAERRVVAVENGVADDDLFDIESDDLRPIDSRVELLKLFAQKFGKSMYGGAEDQAMIEARMAQLDQKKPLLVE